MPLDIDGEDWVCDEVASAVAEVNPDASEYMMTLMILTEEFGLARGQLGAGVRRAAEVDAVPAYGSHDDFVKERGIFVDQPLPDSRPVFILRRIFSAMSKFGVGTLPRRRRTRRSRAQAARSLRASATIPRSWQTGHFSYLHRIRPASTSSRMIFSTSSRSARRCAAMHLSHATLVGRVRKNDRVATADLDSMHRSDEIEDEPARQSEQSRACGRRGVV